KIGTLNIEGLALQCPKNRTEMLPLAEIALARAIELDLPGAALSRITVSAADHISLVHLLKQKRIAPLIHRELAVRGGSKNRVALELLPCEEIVILGDDHPLLGLRLADARVNQPRVSILSENCAAGEDRAFTFIGGWPDRDGQVLPVHQILATRMAPMLLAGLWCKWIELGKRMVPT